MPNCNEPWPPPPHDPRERVEVTRVGAWIVRQLPPTHPRRLHMPPGFAAVQLWHPARRVSLLLPAGITGHAYELFACGRPYAWVKDVDQLAAVAARGFGVLPPSPDQIRALQRMFCAPRAAAVEAR